MLRDYSMYIVAELWTDRVALASKWLVLNCCCVVVCMSWYALEKVIFRCVFCSNASVLVKEDAKNSSSMSGGVSSELSNIGILRTNTNINNEIITMQSPVIMTEVVKRLGLNNVYSVRRGLRMVNLYQDSPIAVTFNQNAHMQFRSW